MKKFWPVLAVMLTAPPSLLAHEMHGGSTSGLFGLKPEYIHVLLNPLPGYGLAVGIAVLLAGYLFKQRPLRVTGLLIVAVCAASAWPVLYFGQHGYNSLSPQLDTESHQWLDTHMSRAERFIFIFYATTAIAVAGLLCLKKFPRTAAALSAATLLASFVSLGVGAWIARAGGEVSHSEFRAQGSSPEMSAPEHQHGKTGKAESGKAETSAASNGHDHTPPSTQGESAHTDHGKAAPTTGSTQTASNVTPDHADHPTASQSSTNKSQSGHEHQTVASGSNAQPAASHQHTDASSATALAHSHGAAAPSASSTNWVPDTPEGIWTQLHRHQAELQTVVAARQLEELHAHDLAIKQLTDALVLLVHPDHKESVQQGAAKIQQAIRAAHKAGHAEDIAGVEANFKQFNDALHELEQQMRKQ